MADNLERAYRQASIMGSASIPALTASIAKSSEGSGDFEQQLSNPSTADSAAVSRKTDYPTKKNKKDLFLLRRIYTWAKFLPCPSSDMSSMW